MRKNEQKKPVLQRDEKTKHWMYLYKIANEEIKKQTMKAAQEIQKWLNSNAK